MMAILENGMLNMKGMLIYLLLSMKKTILLNYTKLKVTQK